MRQLLGSMAEHGCPPSWNGQQQALATTTTMTTTTKKTQYEQQCKLSIITCDIGLIVRLILIVIVNNNSNIQPLQFMGITARNRNNRQHAVKCTGFLLLWRNKVSDFLRIIRICMVKNLSCPKIL